MELIVLYSIIIFSTIIILLYAYLVVEKFHESYINRKKQMFYKEVSDYLDDIASRLDEYEVTDDQLTTLKGFVNDRINREIVEERFLYYLENLKGNISYKLTKLAQDIGLVEYELQKLRSKDMHKVAFACKNLGEIRSKRALNSLLELVDIKVVEVKYNALMALAKIGDEETFIKAFKKLSKTIPLSERSLIEIADSFEGDKIYVYRNLMYLEDEFISSIFIKSAGNYKNTELSDEIAIFLCDENKEKKIAALKALGNMGDNRYVIQIIEFLKDESWEVRAIAAKVLGQLQDSKALIPLVEALSDKQWYVRYNAANSLISIEGGIDLVYDVLEGEDKFAKDIVIAALENKYGYNKAF
ncbi:HEAT repeat domain-containing protein [Alkalithermobacter thermoalcaliphilus]